MTTLPRPITSSNKEDGLELHTGDRMNREEFHRAYELTPDNVKAELIGGIVYVASPLKRNHGVPHISLGAVLVAYQAATPGLEVGDNVTVQLGYDAEPQPDLYLRILPEYGGQSRNSKDDYVAGAPEFVAEIALSSRSIDLHAKRNDYMRNGVVEYLVVCVREGELRWFDLRADRELPLADDKICRVQTFPGLWIDAEALLARNNARLFETLQRGLATPEHAEFAARLAAARKGA
jgi:Uma2 family endonuclease